MLSPKLMFFHNQFPRRWHALLAVPALVVMASCGAEEDGLGKRFAVTGTVTYNGQPLEKGDISFVSEDLKSNFGASGTIVNGAYTLSTGGNGDGAAAGKYKVTITSKADFAGKAQEDFQKATGKQNAKLPAHFTAKAEAESKSLIPAGYGDPRSTTLNAEVKQEPNKINFTISDADAPPAPPAPTKGKGGGRRG